MNVFVPDPEDFPKDWITGETLSRVDVARIFNVDPNTVRKWAQQGVIGFFRTPAGKRVYPEVEVRRLMRGDPASPFVKAHAERDNAKYNALWREGWHRNEKTFGNASGKARQEQDDE